jgi:hypothetical protein
VDGTVLAEDNQPHPGAVIALFPADGKGSPRSQRSDAQGMFHLTAVPPGDYKLIAWDDVSRDDLENPAFEKRFDSQATAITVAAGASAATSIKLASQ